MHRFSIASLVAGITLLLSLTGCQERSGPPASEVPAALPPTAYFEMAMKAATWIDSQARETEQGLAWHEPFAPSDLPPEPPPGLPEHFPMEHGMYKGNIGVIRFWLEAWKHTQDEAFLDRACQGGEHLLASLPQNLPGADYVSFYALYTGWGGVLWTLEQLYDATADERYRQGVLRLLDHIHQLAIFEEEETPDGPVQHAHWGGATELFYGNAGYGLLLLWAAETFDHASSLELATRAGHWLIATAQERSGGLTWPIEVSGERVMPNFSHGTSGNAYFLAALYQATGEQAFLDAALAAAEHLLTIAETGDGSYCLVFHVEGEGEDRHYLGFCHGPVGTTRLFERLYQATGDECWQAWLNRGTRGITISGIPEQETAGFWNNVSQCCGSAGVIEHMVAQYRRTGDATYLDFARRMADDMVARASEENGGLKWIQAEHRVRPEEVEAQVGFMQGAAGIATALLHLDAAVRGLDPGRLAFVDDPWV